MEPEAAVRSPQPGPFAFFTGGAEAPSIGVADGPPIPTAAGGEPTAASKAATASRGQGL